MPFCWFCHEAAHVMLLNTLLLVSVFQHLNIMDWTHYDTKKKKEYPNRVIIGLICHLSDKCSVLLKLLKHVLYKKESKSACCIWNVIVQMLKLVYITYCINKFNYFISTFLNTRFIVIQFCVLHMTLTLRCYQVAAFHAYFHIVFDFWK